MELCGLYDRNLSHVEAALGLQIVRRGNVLLLIGNEGVRKTGEDALKFLYSRLELGRSIDIGEIDSAINFGTKWSRSPIRPGSGDDSGSDTLEIITSRKILGPRSLGQSRFVEALYRHDLVFGIGPAGTGKTYLAVAMAVSMFLKGAVGRIILSRPAVEAGERLGFLPGDMKEKVDPYMQPLYDALRDFLPGKRVARLIESNRIEIAPLAFMRGRTLSNAYVVLDEAQNATSIQMKMFLTRLGPDSRMAITGDMTQIDLPRGVVSGLIEAQEKLRGVEGIAFTRLSARDVVRHGLVARIVEAYGTHANR